MVEDSSILRLGDHTFTAKDLVAILDAVTDGITVQEPSGRIIYANPAAAHVCGFGTVESMLATPPADIVANFELFDEHGEPLSIGNLPGRHALQGQTEEGRQITFRVKSTGEMRATVIGARPVFDAHGNVRFAVNIWHDLTEQVRRQEMLEQNATSMEEITGELEATVEELHQTSDEANAARERAEAGEARHRLLAEAGRQLAVSLDVEETLRMIMHLAVPRIADWAAITLVDNEGLPRQLEVAHADPAKLKFALELQKKYPPDPEEAMRVIRSGKSEMYPEIPEELLTTTARDEEHLRILRELKLRSAMIVPLKIRDQVLGTITFIRAESTRPYGAEDLEVAESLAARSALALSNARLYREAQEANRTKSDFLAVMSHELRTPLTAIFGYTELLATGVSGPITETQSSQLERIRASAAHLLGIIEDILNYARSEAGKDVVAVDVVQISQVVNEVATMMQPAAREKQLALTAETSTDCTLHTDRGKLRQILINLIGNAIKFTSAGSVDVSADCDASWATIRVTDTGPGIPAEDMDRIFEPFRQLQNATTRTAGGTGLGLAVTKRFADLLGGSIAVESTEGEGTTFTVRVPVAT